MENVEIVARSGSHLLLRSGSRFAIVERRGETLYAARSGARDGYREDAQGMAAAARDSGWQDEAAARTAFAEIAARGDALANRIR